MSFYISPGVGSGEAMPEQNVLAEIAAKVADIANDCFDRPAAAKLRELYAELEKLVAGQPSTGTDTPPPE
jgi:hypothetical protein